MNKKGLQLNALFTAIVLASMVIIAVGVIIGDMNEQYGSGVDYDLETDFNKLNETVGHSDNLRGLITNEDIGTQSGDTESNLFLGGYNSILQVLNPFDDINNMLESLEKRFGLPDYVGQGLLALLILGIVFAIIAIIFRTGGSTV